MEVLSSRVLIRPLDPAASRTFYRDTLGLAVYREFGDPDDPGLVFFLGTGMLEVSGRGTTSVGNKASLWLQVRDLDAEHDRLRAAGAPIDRAPTLEPWGLTEMWIHDPDAIPIVIVQVPDDHPLRRDQR
jgi:catechol 2,3-dioxygenase-like lactoylglutathione lyase family enzyme